MNGTLTVTRGDHVAIHTHTAAETAWRATSHLIELATQLILVDTPAAAGAHERGARPRNGTGQAHHPRVHQPRPPRPLRLRRPHRRAGLRTGVGREAHQRGRGATVPGCLCPDRSRRRPDRQPAASTEPSTRAKRPSTAFASASSPPQTPRAATNSPSASRTTASSSPRTSSTTGCTPTSASTGLPLLRLTHCGGGGQAA